MKIQCDGCDAELIQQGALLFGPPVKGKVTKFHLCGGCYQEALRVLFGW